MNKIWIAYSGGVDSHVLLHIVSKNYPNLHAVHINHNLSKNAAKWQQHCQEICANLNVTLVCKEVDATPSKGQSPEDAARVARHKAWQEVVSADDVLLTAHHADDQAETVLYRLFRGAGPKGLTGIPAKVNLNGINVLRPMLGLTKHDLLTYAKENNLQWINDESNASSQFDRNFIRNNLLPQINNRWPAAVNNIARTADLCAELILNLETDDVLDLQFWQKQTVRAWLHKHKINPSVKQLDIVIKEIIQAKDDANPHLKIGKKVIRRYRGKLYITDADINAVSSHGKKAQKIFQQKGIPPWERSNYELVFDNSRLIEISGLWRE